MARPTQFEKDIKSVLKYDASYPYFGELRFSELYSAQRYMRRSEYYNEIGSRDTIVYIGKIDGNIICGALWRLMGYNPGRFALNPFEYNGVNNIYKFVRDNVPYSIDTDTESIIRELRIKLRDYLRANATPNGQWHDKIQTRSDGTVYTVLNDGHTGPVYKMLCLLRDAVKLITQRNCTDFELKSKPYRDKIIAAVKFRHPEKFANNIGTFQPSHTVTPTPIYPRCPIHAPTSDELAEERIYDKMEQLQITLDNGDSVSPELYEQACAEMNELREELYALRRGHSL